MRHLKKLAPFVAAVLVGVLPLTTQAAGGMAQYASNAYLNAIFRGASATGAPAALNVRLYSTCPTDSSAGTELSGNGYSLATLNASTSNWGASGGGASTAGTVQNVAASALSFGTVTSSTWNVQCVAVTDGSANMYFWGPASPAGTVSVGTAVSIAQNQLVISIAMLMGEVQDLVALGFEPGIALEVTATAHGIDLASEVDAGRISFARG